MLNKVQLIGHLGADPEVKFMPNGDSLVNLNIATSHRWKDKKTGEKREQTEWHRVVIFGRLGEICAQYLTKGSQIYIEGRLRTRKWQHRDGGDRYSTEIIADTMQMLGGGSGTDGKAAAAAANSSTQVPAAGNKPDLTAADFDDDIPF